MMHRDARYVAAALQGIVGWEWLTSGANKVLSGGFPAGLAGNLSDGLKSNPESWYVAFIRTVVLPHSVFFGYLIESVEVLTGLALLAGALGLLGSVRRRGEPQYRVAVVQVSASALAALACSFLCVNFHFFAGDGLLPGINPSMAFNEGIDIDTLMLPLALVILFANLALLAEMHGTTLGEQARRLGARLHIGRLAEQPATSHLA